MNKFLDGMKKEANITETLNGAKVHESTLNKVLDLFAFGGAYRQRTKKDCERLFAKAFYEDKEKAMKCLFYLRDIRGGQGERRFFRVCTKWLAENHPDELRRNLIHIPTFGRWDDLIELIDTSVKKDVLKIIKEEWTMEQSLDIPTSLFFKWMPSINTSSKGVVRKAQIIRKYLGLSEKQYRQTLSEQRAKLKVLEKLMSSKNWDEIEFDKIPSNAGLKYIKAFQNREELRDRYADFMNNKETKVNAGTLYPYDVVRKALSVHARSEKNIVNKYWDNLTDYFNGCVFDGIAVVDVSGSMLRGVNSVSPITVALSLGLYCADKCSGPFKNHFITFSLNPNLVEIVGDTFYDRIQMMGNTEWGMNTDIEKTFDLILDTAIKNHLSQDELPKNLLIISDMQFDEARASIDIYGTRKTNKNILFRQIESKWFNAGYDMPHLVFWNVNATTNIIPDMGKGYVTYVSGASPVILKQILEGKTGLELCLETICSERYECIKAENE